jgi:hypothetical protein
MILRCSHILHLAAYFSPSKQDLVSTLKMKYIICYFNINIIQIISCAIQTCYYWKGPSIIIAFAVIFHWHLFTISWLIVIFTYQFISNTRVQSPTFDSSIALKKIDSSRNIVKLLFRYNETKSYFQLCCITVNSHNISEKKSGWCNCSTLLRKWFSTTYLPPPTE